MGNLNTKRVADLGILTMSAVYKKNLGKIYAIEK